MGFGPVFLRRRSLGRFRKEDQRLYFGHTKSEILMRQRSGKIKYVLGDADVEVQGEVKVGDIHVGQSAERRF